MAFKKEAGDQAEAILAAKKDTPNAIEYEFVDYKGACSASCSLCADSAQLSLIVNRHGRYGARLRRPPEPQNT